jgi:DNA adenine methylase
LRAEWTVTFFPPPGGPGHKAYLEPCGGAASVLLRKPPCRLETYNDLDGRVVNFFRVLRSQPADLVEALALTPWAEEEFVEALDPAAEALEDARRFFLACWGGLRGGPTPGPFDFRWQAKITRRSAPPQDVDMLDHLLAAARRLRRVVIMRREALELIERVIRADTRGDWLIYFDPPYLAGTRANPRGYRYEPDDAWHEEAAALLRQAKGPVVVAGYPSALYERLYEAAGWRRYERGYGTNSGGKRVEAVWVKETP